MKNIDLNSEVTQWFAVFCENQQQVTEISECKKKKKKIKIKIKF